MLPNQLHKVFCVCRREAGETYGHRQNELTQKRVNNTCILTVLGLSNNGYFLSQCFTEATFGYSDGRTHSQPPHSKGQRQHAESRGKPKPPHRSDDIYYQAPDVSEGKHAFAFHFYPVIVVNRTPSFDVYMSTIHTQQTDKGERQKKFCILKEQQPVVLLN